MRTAGGEIDRAQAECDSPLVPMLEHFSRLPLPGGASPPLQVLRLRELLKAVQERPPEANPTPSAGTAERNGLLTARDVSALLGISDKTVYRFAKDGRIPYVRLQSSLRFRRSDVEQWIESRAFQPKKR
jgi:excisionase family DNA binding protein